MVKLRDFCKQSDETEDNFVGIRYKEGVPEVVFPHGYSIQNDEKILRKDIFKLLAVLQSLSDRRTGIDGYGDAETASEYPLTSYQYIILDFISNGYYVEKEIEHLESERGKISWKRTIQKEKPIMSGRSPVYLKFQTKTVRVNDNNLISLIHKWCVYESFRMFGWLYFTTDYVPVKPELNFDEELFAAVLKEEIVRTFNDNKKRLLDNMLNIITKEVKSINFRDFQVGLYHFETVWERLVDKTFGVPENEKSKYFPHAYWQIIEDGKALIPTSALRPDTLMIDEGGHPGKIYILDAKYYRYGVGKYKSVDLLPRTDSVQKQITYAKYVERKGYAKTDDIYSAFLMPYEGQGSTYATKFVAVACTDWEGENIEKKNYSYILGLLVDTRYLVNNYADRNLKEISKLADDIERAVEKCKLENLGNLDDVLIEKPASDTNEKHAGTVNYDDNVIQFNSTDDILKVAAKGNRLNDVCTIVNGSITKVFCDCIVCQAREDLAEVVGINSGIFAAAGRDKLTSACKRLGGCQIGEVVETASYDLENAKYIIHAVGPRVTEGLPSLLRSCYVRALEKAVELNCHSIAFPLLSAGWKGNFSTEDAWRFAAEGCDDFLTRYPNYEMKIIFSVSEHNQYVIGQKTFKGWRQKTNISYDRYENG